MQFHYIGEVEVTFPSISKVLQPDEVFEAPDDFVAHNVVSVNTPQTTESPIIEPVVPTEKIGE